MAEGRLRIELLRRLATLTPGSVVQTLWDARVVDARDRVLSACDHGHPDVAQAQACGQRQLDRLEQ